MLPSEHITLWHGLIIGVGFLPQAFATALNDLGFPIASAISLYDLVSPYWILSISVKTKFSKSEYIWTK